jgi:hypothetical protein
VSQTPRSDSNGRAWVRSPPLFSAELRGEGGRRGSRTPKGQEAHPFSRRDTAPIAVLPSNFARVAPAGLEPACPRVRAGSSLRLSYGADVAGRTRTCDAPRFRRALYRPSFGHQTWARLDSNQQLPVCRTGAHPIELLARAFRDKDSNLDSHVQSVVSFPLDDPGSPCISVHPSLRDRRSSTASSSCFPVAVGISPPSLLCPSHSPTLRPWIAGRSRARLRDAVFVEGLWSPSLVRAEKKSRLMPTHIHLR